jgi:hypothetical protein
MLVCYWKRANAERNQLTPWKDSTSSRCVYCRVIQLCQNESQVASYNTVFTNIRLGLFKFVLIYFILYNLKNYVGLFSAAVGF